MELENIKSELEKKLSLSLINPRILLDRLRLIDEDSRRSPQYQDPNYLPFFYYLSGVVSPKVILNIGLDLALPICCFLKGCHSAKRLIALQPDLGSFYSQRLAISNIKDTSRLSVDFHFGGIADEGFLKMISGGLDLVVISEHSGFDLSDILEICWQNLNLNGFLVLDKVSIGSAERKFFSDFCRSKNRDFIFFNTRYGTALSAK